jgi:hypothetical protein
MKRNMKQWISLILKFALGIVVIVFLASESLIFFGFVFPPDKWYLTPAGLGLTMGTALVYLYLLLNDADTSLKRVIALCMMGVGVVGELATAGFGMQVEAWAKVGYIMTTDDIDLMVLVIRILMGIQGVALLAYFSGDQIVEMFQDEDNDGIPNAFDKDYKGRNKSQMSMRSNGSKPIIQNASETEAVTDFTSRPPQNK